MGGIADKKKKKKRDKTRRAGTLEHHSALAQRNSAHQALQKEAYYNLLDPNSSGSINYFAERVIGTGGSCF